VKWKCKQGRNFGLKSEGYQLRRRTYEVHLGPETRGEENVEEISPAHQTLGFGRASWVLSVGSEAKQSFITGRLPYCFYSRAERLVFRVLPIYRLNYWWDPNTIGGGWNDDTNLIYRRAKFGRNRTTHVGVRRLSVFCFVLCQVRLRNSTVSVT